MELKERKKEKKKGKKGEDVLPESESRFKDEVLLAEFNPDIIKRCCSSCSDMSSRTYSLSQFQEMIMGIQNRYKRVGRLEKVTFQSGLRIVADRGKQEVQIVHFFVL